MAPLYIGDQAYKVYRGSVEQKVYQGANLISGAGLVAGSLVIEDDTLDVAWGGTVSLRVKLGAQPGSNVTVAASESIEGVSVSPASRTFSPANWNVYQSFTITADEFGNEGTVNLPGGAVSSNSIFWELDGPNLDNSLTPPGTVRNVRRLTVFNSGALRLDLGPGHGFTDSPPSGNDLSDAVETSGSLTVTLLNGTSGATFTTAFLEAMK